MAPSWLFLARLLAADVEDGIGCWFRPQAEDYGKRPESFWTRAAWFRESVASSAFASQVRHGRVREADTYTWPWT
jgi:hypothetical protein